MGIRKSHDAKLVAIFPPSLSQCNQSKQPLPQKIQTNMDQKLSLGEGIMNHHQVGYMKNGRVSLVKIVQ